MVYVDDGPCAAMLSISFRMMERRPKDTRSPVCKEALGEREPQSVERHEGATGGSTATAALRGSDLLRASSKEAEQKNPEYCWTCAHAWSTSLGLGLVWGFWTDCVQNLDRAGALRLMPCSWTARQGPTSRTPLLDSDTHMV